MMNMKKTLALLLAAVMVLGMFPFGAMAEETAAHLDTCLEGCALEDCACPCHTPAPAAEEPQPEQPQPEQPKQEEPKQEEPQPEQPKQEQPKQEEPKQEQPKPEQPQPEQPKQEEPKQEEPKQEQPKQEQPKQEQPKQEQPKQEQPKQEQPTCTCTPAEDGTHAETCAQKPQEPVEEVAPVDYAALYESIMNCEDLFAADALVDALTEQQLAAFEASLTEEQSTALDAHYAALIAAYEAEVPIEPVPEEEAAKEDTREIVYITKDMTKAAPFGAPVEGPAKRMLMRSFRAAPAAQDENGLILDKSVSGPNTNGEYTITLEAYATGAKTIIQQSTSVPTDIVLVLDQSMSMKQNFSKKEFNEFRRTLEELYNKRNDLYVKLSGDAYAPVNVMRKVVGQEEKYTPYSNGSNFEYSRSNNLYHLHDDGTYGKITVSYSYESYRLVYTYSCSKGDFNKTSDGYNTVPEFANNFYQSSTEYSYQYDFSYENADGEVVMETVPAGGSAPNWDFYEYATTSTTTRLAALKEAVRIFADSVAQKAQGADPDDPSDDVNHRIAVVGFGQKGNSYTDTELFVGSTPYGYTSAREHYGEAFQNMNERQGVNNVNASINALSADGFTYINLGMKLANGVLEANQVPSGQKRNRVIVVFTDGVPGGNITWSPDSDSTAEAAVTEAQTAKNAGVTVYTVGIFDGADASSPGAETGSDNAQRANRFMQNLSSNNGTPQTPSYYLSASDSAALNDIFKTISQNIESGGSSVTLNSSTVVKDIIANSFKLPNNANTGAIKVYTDDVNSTNGEFNNNPQPFNASVTIHGKDISVTNFNFSENWVGTETDASGNVTWRGRKLIIKIPIVPETNFLGGNNVPTNGEASGVYSGGELVEAFKAQITDVSIKDLDIGVATTGQNIYLTNDADLAKLVTGLDKRINGANNAYVKITYQIKDGDTVVGTVTIPAGGTVPTSITWTEAENQDMTPGLEADKTYTIVATAEPVTTGTAKATTNNETANVNVFKPTVTWKDSEVSYNQTPDYEGENVEIPDNLASVVWKHNTTLSSDVSMLNNASAPVLHYTYNPKATQLKAESHVTITKVEIGETDVTQYVTHEHKDCTITGCKWDAADHTDGCNFIVHLATFDLTITKAGVKEEDSNAAFIFNVSGNGVNMNVVIYGGSSVTIKNLPAGDYTVTETGGYWRYTLDNAVRTASATNPSVTFTNALKTNQWLDDIASVTNKFTGNKSDSITR